MRAKILPNTRTAAGAYRGCPEFAQVCDVSAHVGFQLLTPVVHVQDVRFVVHIPIPKGSIVVPFWEYLIEFKI